MGVWPRIGRLTPQMLDTPGLSARKNGDARVACGCSRASPSFFITPGRRPGLLKVPLMFLGRCLLLMGPVLQGGVLVETDIEPRVPVFAQFRKGLELEDPY